MRYEGGSLKIHMRSWECTDIFRKEFINKITKNKLINKLTNFSDLDSTLNALIREST
jgi:hypothetical protein